MLIIITGEIKDKYHAILEGLLENTHFCERACDFTFDYMQYLIEGFNGNLSQCKSPIEEILTVLLVFYTMCIRAIINVKKIMIKNQYPVEVDGKTYHIDIMIVVVLPDDTELFFPIECDGYEFHAATKEQVAKDKTRDRKLTKAGYNTIRFTGSQIYNESSECVREIIQIILSKIRTPLIKEW